MFDFRQRITGWVHGLAFIGMTGLVGLAVITVIDVLLRWLFNSPIFGLENVVDVIIPIVIACAIPTVLVFEQNVTIPVIGQMLGRPVGHWFSIFGHLVTLTFFGLLTWQIAIFSMELGTDGRVMEILKLPIAPWWWAITGILVLCTVTQLIVLVARLSFRAGEIAVLDPGHLEETAFRPDERRADGNAER